MTIRHRSNPILKIKLKNELRIHKSNWRFCKIITNLLTLIILTSITIYAYIVLKQEHLNESKISIL